VSNRPRTFYVALGVPRGAETETIQPAYRRVVTRYRRMLEGDDDPEDALDEPTEPPLDFRVMRSYSERRHGALFDEPEPLVNEGARSEVDRFYEGFVPEVAPAKAVRTGKDLYVEIRLDPDEARRGGIFPVHIPVLRRCTACEGHGDEQAQLTCPVCQGSRKVTVDRMVEVTAPPGVTHGQVERLAMEDVGLDATDLVVLILVS
jgi:DnaJ-class molecular chaperone